MIGGGEAEESEGDEQGDGGGDVMDRRAEENDWRETVFTEDLCFSLAKTRPDYDLWRHFFMDVENF